MSLSGRVTFDPNRLGAQIAGARTMRSVTNVSVTHTETAVDLQLPGMQVQAVSVEDTVEISQTMVTGGSPLGDLMDEARQNAIGTDREMRALKAKIRMNGSGFDIHAAKQQIAAVKLLLPLMGREGARQALSDLKSLARNFSEFMGGMKDMMGIHLEMRQDEAQILQDEADTEPVEPFSSRADRDDFVTDMRRRLYGEAKVYADSKEDLRAYEAFAGALEAVVRAVKSKLTKEDRMALAETTGKITEHIAAGVAAMDGLGEMLKTNYGLGLSMIDSQLRHHGLDFKALDMTPETPSIDIVM